jgi:PPOX class probable F420-dependent enzyme
MATLSENQAKLFTGRNFGHVGTIRPDGSPQVTPVWIDYDGEHVVFNTAVGRAKYQNLRRDPRVTVEVLNMENPYEYVMVSGTAELQEGDEAERHIDKLAKKYMGVDEYPHRTPEERRVLVRVTPELVAP